MQSISILCMSALLGAPAAKEPAKKAEVPSVVGTWSCQTMTANGKVQAINGHSTFTFSADGKFQISVGGDDKPAGKYKINRDASPAELDFNIGGGDEFHLGVFKIEKDELTLCWEDVARVRPKEFGAPIGTTIVQMRFIRLEPKKK